MTCEDHNRIIEAMGGKDRYGKGITPNPFEHQQAEWRRVDQNLNLIEKINTKIRSLFEPRFITPPETSSFIASLVTMTNSRRILEIGMHSGFGSLHILKAIVGTGATLTSVEPNPIHDLDWFREFEPQFMHIKGFAPDILKSPKLVDRGPFDCVFIDSVHSMEQTESEIIALAPITRKGSILLFHDLPEWSSDTDKTPPAVRVLIQDMAKDSSRFVGCILPTCNQLDCELIYGKGYPSQLNPNLGILIRTFE